ncbi:MAG: dihydrolipoamide acetyltransferase, partial [bacterium]
ERARKAAPPADGSNPAPAQGSNAAPAQTPADAAKPQVSGDNNSQALNPEVNKTAPGQPTDTTKKSP